MKGFLVALLMPSMVFAASKINCETVERYNDERIEDSFSVEINDDTAFKQIASKRDGNILFVVYYSKTQDVFGARINDQDLGSQSGTFVEPSREKGLVKVRYIKNKPEAQLFALDCVLR